MEREYIYRRDIYIEDIHSGDIYIKEQIYKRIYVYKLLYFFIKKEIRRKNKTFKYLHIHCTAVYNSKSFKKNFL